MFISVKELELREISFDETLPPESEGLELGPELRLVEPLRARGRAELLEEHRGKQVVQDIRLVGAYETGIELRCARCLEPVRSRLASDFDLLFRPQGVDRRADESAITEAETEIGYYQGEGIELQDALKEQVLLAAPVKAVCREDCKGLCPECGKNWNQEKCDCAPVMADPRWAALEDYKRNKFER